MSVLRYEARLQKLIDYIYDHLEEPLDLFKMADVAGISQYHLHRIYTGIYGESLASMIKRLRLHHAAKQLAHSDMSIKDIAAVSGYPRLQSFSRVFSAEFGLPPATYRREGCHTHFKALTQLAMAREKSMHQVRMETTPALTLLAYPHTGSYMNIGKAFEKLSGWASMRNVFNQDTRMVGVYFCDPDNTPESELRSLAGITMAPAQRPELDEPLELFELPSAECAVLTFKGPYADMHSAYHWFYGQWLANSGREAADAPAYEIYLNDPRSVAPTELLTDIYLPLKAL